MNGEGEVEVAIGGWLVGGGSGVVEDDSPSYARVLKRRSNGATTAGAGASLVIDGAAGEGQAGVDGE